MSKVYVFGTYPGGYAKAANYGNGTDTSNAAYATGGAGSGNYGGAGGAANAIVSFTLNTTSGVQGIAYAYGGNAGYNKNGGQSGAGGAATSQVNVTGSGQVYGHAGSAGGGVGRLYQGGYPDGAGVATVTATSTGTGSVTAVAGAGGGPSGNATASATALNGLAVARSAAAGAVGYCRTLARTGGAGVVIGASANAQAPVSPVTFYKAIPQAASAVSVAGSTRPSFGYGSPSSYSAAIIGYSGDLSGFSNVSAAFSGPSAAVFAAGTLSESYFEDASGSQEYISSDNFTLDRSKLSGDLILGLLDDQTLGSGFDSLTFTVDVGGVTDVSKTFTSVSEAQAFFTNTALDLGATTGTGSLLVSVTFDLVTSSAGSGFGSDFVLGDTGPQIFTEGSDNVDFNRLSTTQLSAIQSGAQIYNGLGGSDIVTLPSVANYAASGWDPSKTFSTGSLPGDVYSVTGSDGNYNIQLGAGADSVTITGNGSSTITDDSGADTISLASDGSNTINLGSGTAAISLGASGDTIVFNAADQGADLALSAGDTENIKDFVQGDEIDLTGFNFDDVKVKWASQNEEILKVTTATGLVKLDFSQLYNGSTIFTESDGSGGTDLLLGPSALDLAGMSSDAYDTGPVPVVDGFSYDPKYSVSLPDGFAADVFENGEEFVIAFRGSVPLGAPLDTFFENWVDADPSWADDAATATLKQYIEDGAAVINEIDTFAGGAPIILTGHSLGGGIAQILGAQTGLPTMAFDAPQSGGLYSQFSMSSIPPFIDKGTDDNIRMYGDVVSLAGDAFGGPVPNADNWTIEPSAILTEEEVEAVAASPALGPLLVAPDAHDLKGLMISALASTDAPLVPGLAGPLTFTLPAPATPMGTASGPTLGSLFSNAVTALAAFSDILIPNADSLIPFDPGAATSYALVGASGSPLIATVTLPDIGADHYEIETLSGGVWSSPETVAALTPATFGGGVTGVSIQAYDANGDVMTMPQGFVVLASFTAAGSFSGTLYTQLDSHWADGGGDWMDSSQWSAGAAPDPTTNAVIGGSGTFTVTVSDTESALSVKLKSAGATVVDTGALVVSGETKINDGTFEFGVGGVLTSQDVTIGSEGVVEVASGAVGALASPVTNNGTLETDGGKLKLKGAVSGTGSVMIDGGKVKAKAAFDQNVTFGPAGGELVLSDSQPYTGTLTGFSTSGGTSLVLQDIGFVSAGEATFVGTPTGGTLTVTDGVHTANIALVGDYLSSTFTASSDGNGGVLIVDPVAMPAAQNSAATSAASGFAHAMAGLRSKNDGGSIASARSMTPPTLAPLSAPGLHQFA